MATSGSHYDYLILGSGIAGLYAALLAAQHGRVGVLTKGPINESNTKYAQGGIAAAVGPGDSPAAHFDDTLRAGAGLCDPAAVRILVEEAPDRIRRLIELGVPFDTAEGALGREAAMALGREAAHSASRILHAGGDRTGDAIETVMVRRVTEAGIDVLDRHTAIDLLIENGRCRGAIATTPVGEPLTVTADWTILATGGAGRLYTLTTNPEVATGDGIALAFRAGATVQDLEFIQFHPTALRLPELPAFLISESMRGEGAILRTLDGRRFMADYHPEAELAPRDIVARAIASEMQRTHSDHVLLDITHRDPEFSAARFPGIYRHCLQYELDITRQPVPVAPAAHYIMGGVLTDTWGRTTVPGLLACGEVACTGVHGANRLASNSLLETVVFAQRAVEASLQPDCGAASTPINAVPLDGRITGLAAPDLPALQALLWQHAGIVRHREGLSTAAAILDGWRADAPSDPTLRNVALIGRLIVEAALRRRESRGAHFRSDFPAPSPAWEQRLSFRHAPA